MHSGMDVFRGILVSFVKHCLKKTVGKVCLNFFELQVILSETVRPIVMMIPVIYWHLITCYLDINCTRSLQILNTVTTNLKLIYQNVLNMSRIQLNIFGKEGEQNMWHLWENIKNCINRKPNQCQINTI